jgi:hypothetical protein
MISGYKDKSSEEAPNFYLLSCTLFGGSRSDGAVGLAGAALDAGVGVDDVLAGFFLDAVDRAVSLAGAALYASLGIDLVSHC